MYGSAVNGGAETNENSAVNMKMGCIVMGDVVQRCLLENHGEGKLSQALTSDSHKDLEYREGADHYLHARLSIWL